MLMQLSYDRGYAPLERLHLLSVRFSRSLEHLICDILFCDFLCVPNSVFWCPLPVPYGGDVRFIFPTGCLWEGLCLVCVCLRIVLCCVFVFGFSSPCVPYVAAFSGLLIFGCPFVILCCLFVFWGNSKIDWHF